MEKKKVPHFVENLSGRMGNFHIDYMEKADRNSKRLDYATA